MTTMETATETTTATLEPPPPPLNLPAGVAGDCAKPAENITNFITDPKAEQAMARLHQLENLGRLLKKKFAEKDRKETIVAGKTAERKEAMEAVNTVEREIAELQEEMVTLSTGGHTEKLFPPKADAESKPAAAPAPADAWKSVHIESLGGLSVRVLKALREKDPPLITIGDLSEWQQAKGDFWAKDIRGLGAKGREELENALQGYWITHPPETKDMANAAATEFDDAAIKAGRGRRRKARQQD